MRQTQLATMASLVFLCGFSSAEDRLHDHVSPRLGSFLDEKPEAFNVLTNALVQSFGDRSYSILYFYSKDDSRPRAYHFYPKTAGVADVVICIRENQQPIDEFISILFEVVNTRGETRFWEIIEKARSGAISKAEFARSILRVEMDASITTRDLLVGVEFGEAATADSSTYRSIANCPDDFEEFLTYLKKGSPQSDAVRIYEDMHTALQHGTNAQPFASPEPPPRVSDSGGQD